MTGRKHLLGWLSLIVSLLLLAILVAPAFARVERIDVEGVSATCSRIEGEITVSGNTVHIDDRYGNNEVVAWNIESGDIVPALTGQNDVWVDIVVNRNTGRATYHGTFNFHPFDIPDGEWLGTFSGWVAPNEIDSHYLVVAKGAGALDKWHMQLTEEGVPEIPPGVVLCGGDEPLSMRRIEGYIRMPVD